jgi:hypothetical protein
MMAFCKTVAEEAEKQWKISSRRLLSVRIAFSIGMTIETEYAPLDKHARNAYQAGQRQLANPLHHNHSFLPVNFGVDFRHRGRAMAEDDTGHVETEFLPQPGRSVVTQLIRVP